MKLLPIPPLPSLASPSPFLWGSDLLWRYPPSFTTPLNDLKTQLPSQLPTDPRLWGRDDVGIFLRWCEREFDLPKFEMDLFQMNGKALCLLTKTDLAERIPGAGDILHNILHMLVRDAQMLHRHLPNSPITPTSRYYPSSPHSSHPPTPNWTQLAPPDSPFHTTSAHLQQFIANSNSVTLSPAPSIDSQVGSPPQNGGQQNGNGSGSSAGSDSGSSSSLSGSGLLSQQQHQMVHSQALQQQHQQQQQQQQQAAFFGNMLQAAATTAANGIKRSSTSDSEDDSSKAESLQQANATATAAAMAAATILAANVSNGNSMKSEEPRSPPLTPIVKKEGKVPKQLTNFVSTWQQHQSSTAGQYQYQQQQQNIKEEQKSLSAPGTPYALIKGVKHEFFPSETGEPNTNGRLLWDFLQQLLNDPQQRYSSYIAWKCRDTGVFKIVDPAGLAQLWGIQKNHLSMNYDKMSRALRYYYRVNILRKVQGERHCYQFLRNPSELKSIKNISLLRQQTAASAGAASSASPSSTTSLGGSSSAAPPSSPSFSSFSVNGSNYTINYLSSANTPSNSASSTSALGSSIPPPSPSAFQTSFQHLALSNNHHQQLYAAAAAQQQQQQHYQLSPPPKMVKQEPLSSRVSVSPSSSSSSVDMDELPTDLSTGGDRKPFNPDCFPLIRNSNGLTTIQLVQKSLSPVPSPRESSGYHGTSEGSNEEESSPMENDDLEKSDRNMEDAENVQHTNAEINLPTDLRKME